MATIHYEYLEYVEPTKNSAKFYEVTYLHAERLLVRRWGRIGTAGQMQTKANTIQADHREAANAKIARGYDPVVSNIIYLGNGDTSGIARAAERNDKHGFLASLDQMLAGAGSPGLVPAIGQHTSDASGYTPTKSILDESESWANKPDTTEDTGVFGSDPSKDGVAAEHLGLGLLAERAQRLVPAVAQNPLEHAVTVAEVREQAAKYRSELQLLDSHLNLLDALLTEGIAR